MAGKAQVSSSFPATFMEMKCKLVNFFDFEYLENSANKREPPQSPILLRITQAATVRSDDQKKLMEGHLNARTRRSQSTFHQYISQAQAIGKSYQVANECIWKYHGGARRIG